MKTAISVWEGRVAPVFDTARELYLVESEASAIKREERHDIPGDHPLEKAAWLTAQGVETLVCGAISHLLQERLAAANIKVVPFIAGDCNKVLEAYLKGTLQRPAFLMPGCCGQRKRSCRGRRCQGGSNTF